MKKFLFAAFLATIMVRTATAQEVKPELLKEPASWTFERFPLPPAFAPAITYHGFEELRFAPGMFKKDAPDYFAYAFVASLDSVSSFTQEDIQRYLVNYYKGLSASVAAEKKFTVDTSKVTATVTEKSRLAGGDVIYNAELDVLGVFADAALVKLNMEVKVMKDPDHHRLYLLFITAAQPKTADIWKELYQIQAAFRIPAP